MSVTTRNPLAALVSDAEQRQQAEHDRRCVYRPSPPITTPCVNHPSRQADTFAPDDRAMLRPLCSPCATPLWAIYYEGRPS
jgi:hypothetical protein